MLKNYLRIVIRKMKRQKIYSLINIFGLAIGIAGAIFISMWIRDEINYDCFHKNADRIYRTYQVFHYGDRHLEQTQTPGIFATKVKEECPEVELVTRLRIYLGENIVAIKDRQFNEHGLGIADESFFRFFSFPLITGDPANVLSKPNTVAISQKTAKKYFGNLNPVGKVLTIFNKDYAISGVFKDMPNQSHFHADVLMSFASFERYQKPAWGLNVFKTYILLKEGCTAKELEVKLKQIVKNNMFDSSEKYESVIAKGDYTKFLLQPLTDIHLNSDLLWEFEANGNGTYVKFFTIIAAFILLIAIINYINLSTARSTERAREIGIRKTMGSTRMPLIRQFLAESIIMSLMSFVLALGFLHIFISSFRNLVGKPWLTIPYLDNPFLLLPMIVLAIIIGIIAGIYPAFVLSSFKPANIVTGKINQNVKGSALRNGLVLVQFVISIILLIMTLVVQKQMNFIQDRDLGYNEEHVVVINTYGNLTPKLPIIKEELLHNSSVLSATASSSVPGESFDNIGMGLEGSNSSHGTNLYIADADFLTTMQMEISEGRYFEDNISSDGQAVILNESMVKLLNVNNLLDKRMMIWAGSEGQEPFRIIGIVKDFHYESLHELVKPMVIVKLNGTIPWSESYLSIRVQTGNIVETIKYISDTWEKIVPGTPFEYSFLDSIYNAQYQNEKRTGKVFVLFTGFMIFVACLGLLGMASFVVEKRTKEIAIRKVMGASINRIVLMLTGDFIRWSVFANLIAWPIAYYLVAQWLTQFAYRSDIGILPFTFATLLILLLTCLTIVYHAYKAAFTNPVNSLHYE
ncbi:MAG: ABC transporter permease [bacterium]